jgi:hypothetical protein
LDRCLDLGRIGDEAGRVEVSQAPGEQIGGFPGALGGDALVEDYGQEEGERIIDDEPVGSGIVGGELRSGTGFGLCQRGAWRSWNWLPSSRATMSQA